MLKTSSIKSAEPRKGVVGVGGGGRNRVEPVGKYELDGNDNDGVGRSSDSDRKFHLLYDSQNTQLNTQDELINGLIN